MDQFFVLVLLHFLLFLGLFWSFSNRKNLVILITLMLGSFLILGLCSQTQTHYAKTLDLEQGLKHYFEMISLVGFYAFILSVILIFLVYLILEGIAQGQTLLSAYFLVLVSALILYTTLLLGLVPPLSFFVTIDFIELAYYDNLSLFEYRGISFKDFLYSQMSGEPILLPEELKGQASSTRLMKNGCNLTCEDYWQAFSLGAQKANSSLPESVLRVLFSLGKFPR